MKALKITGAFLGIVILLFVVVGLILPTTWHVERSVVINAPPEAIHPWVNSFRKWEQWAAWNNEMDPSRKVDFDGPEEGVGAAMRWQGDKMGRGRIAIAKSDPKLGVWIDEAIESDQVNAHGSITYAAVEGGGTRVTWVDDGDVGMKPIGGYFVGMLEGALGEHFQAGLDKLKRAIEERK